MIPYQKINTSLMRNSKIMATMYNLKDESEINNGYKEKRTHGLPPQTLFLSLPFFNHLRHSLTPSFFPFLLFSFFALTILPTILSFHIKIANLSSLFAAKKASFFLQLPTKQLTLFLSLFVAFIASYMNATSSRGTWAAWCGIGVSSSQVGEGMKLTQLL